MILLILVGFLTSAYCSDDYGNNGYKNEERRIAGGGNYGGFIGLTTYPAGPFFVKGKYERDSYGGFDLNWQGYGQRGLKEGESYDDGSQRYNDGKSDDSKKDDDRDRKDDGSKNNDGKYDVEYIPNVGYEEVQKDQSYYGQGNDGDKKNDEYIEYLGYNAGRGYCTGGYKDRDGYSRNQGNNSSNYYDDERRERCDYLFGFTGPTANDEPDNLIRPCAMDDWQCIRKYFAANGKCKPTYGPIPDPLYIDINTIFFPFINVTVALPNLMVRGLSSAKIREFYVNKKSGNLVFAIDVTNFNETIPRAYFRYRRTGKESIVLADFATIQYRALTFTAVIPKVPNLRLELAEIHVDAQDGTAPFFIGPGAFNSTDPDVVTAATQLTLFLPISIREGLAFQAQLFTAIYIQENICDFGLKIISV